MNYSLRFEEDVWEGFSDYLDELKQSRKLVTPTLELSELILVCMKETESGKKDLHKSRNT